MLKKKTYPGYLYMAREWRHDHLGALERGPGAEYITASTVWGQWFYQSVGGIRPIDGKVAYSEICIDPADTERG